MRHVHCFYDESKGSWMAEFDDPQLIDRNKKIYETSFKNPDESNKVLRTMQNQWKGHHVTLSLPEKERVGHPAMGRPAS